MSLQFLGFSAPLALLLFPFVHQHAGAPSNSTSSLLVDILIAFSLAMGFCVPLFLFHAEIRRRRLSNDEQTSKDTSRAALRQEIKIEMKSYYWAAAVGVVIGIGAVCVSFF